MKKMIFILLTLFCTLPAFSERYKLGNGLTLITYGNTAVIEDDNTQQTISLSVEQRQDNFGRVVYDVFCGNQYTKGVIKQGLKDAIAYIIPATASAIGSYGGPAGTAAGGAIGAAIAPYINTIASRVYDDVCDYYAQ